MQLFNKEYYLILLVPLYPVYRCAHHSIEKLNELVKIEITMRRPSDIPVLSLTASLPPTGAHRTWKSYVGSLDKVCHAA